MSYVVVLEASVVVARQEGLSLTARSGRRHGERIADLLPPVPVELGRIPMPRLQELGR